MSHPLVPVRALLGALALAAVLAGPSAGRAQPSTETVEAAAEVMPAWLHALLKTATYETTASIDALVMGLWWSGDGLTGTGFAAISAASAAAAYYLHELAWNRLGPDPNQAGVANLALYKTVTYRVVSGTRVMILTYLLTGSILASTTYVAINTVIDSLVYFGNDYAWATWGPAVEHLGQ